METLHLAVAFGVVLLLRWSLCCVRLSFFLLLSCSRVDSSRRGLRELRADGAASTVCGLWHFRFKLRSPISDWNGEKVDLS